MAFRDAEDEKFAVDARRRAEEGAARTGRREATSLTIDCEEAMVEDDGRGARRGGERAAGVLVVIEVNQQAGGNGLRSCLSSGL